MKSSVDGFVSIIAAGCHWRPHDGVWCATLADGQHATVWRGRLGIYWAVGMACGQSAEASVIATCHRISREAKDRAAQTRQVRHAS